MYHKHCNKSVAGASCEASLDKVIPGDILATLNTSGNLALISCSESTTTPLLSSSAKATTCQGSRLHHSKAKRTRVSAAATSSSLSTSSKWFPDNSNLCVAEPSSVILSSRNSTWSL